MRRKALFTSSILETLPTSLMDNVNEEYRQPLNNLIDFVKNKIGQFVELSVYYYRVTNTNYAKLKVLGMHEDGSPTDFSLSLVLAGYIEIPTADVVDSARFTLTVTDATDAYWFIKLLQASLSEETS